MKLTDFIKKLIRNYFIIFAIIVICLTVLRNASSVNQYIELNEIYIYMIAALLGDLPSLVFYSPKEISERDMRTRLIIHFILLEAVLLTFGNVLGFVKSIQDMVIFSIEIAGIYAIIRFLSFIDDKKAADSINEKLKAMKNESADESKE